MIPVNFFFDLPLPHRLVALYWGRMLPFSEEHRQPATGTCVGFRNDKPATFRTSSVPNRYLATDSGSVGDSLSCRPTLFYGFLGFAMQKDLRV